MIRSSNWALYLPPDEPGESPQYFCSYNSAGPLTEKEARLFLTSMLHKAKPWLQRIPKGSRVIPETQDMLL